MFICSDIMGNILACFGRRKNTRRGLRTFCSVCFQRIPKELRARAALKLFECQIEMEKNPQYAGSQFKQFDTNFLLVLDWFKCGDTEICPVCGQEIAEGSAIAKLIAKWT